MNKDRAYILEFVRNLSFNNYAAARKSLQNVIEEKMKKRIKKSMKMMEAKDEPKLQPVDKKNPGKDPTPSTPMTKTDKYISKRRVAISNAIEKKSK